MQCLDTQQEVLLWDVSFSPDGKWALDPGPIGAPRIFDVASGVELFRFKGDVNSWKAQFHPDGKRALTIQSNGTVLLWDLRPPDVPAAKNDAEGIWEGLASPEGPTAYRAVWSLVDDPVTAVSLLKRKLKHAPTGLNRNAVLQRIARLDDDDFPTREQASKQLLGEGPAIFPLLAEAYETSQLPEQRRRLQEILERMPQERSRPDDWRIVRAVQALELGGSAEGKKLLMSWIDDRNGVLLAEQARQAVARMSK
jgi:hypothetical protein